jgi:glutaredoxin-like protein
MSIIQEKDKKPIEDRLAGMVKPVTIVNFTQELECMYCRETRELLKELSSLSDKLSLEVYNFQLDKDTAERYKIDKIPATIIKAEGDRGIHFYGVPAGYEFVTLLESIVAVSAGDSGLGEKTRERIRTVSRPVHIQVFVTPT